MIPLAAASRVRGSEELGRVREQAGLARALAGLEQGRRSGAERAVGEELQPAEGESVRGRLADPPAAAEPALDRVLEPVGANAGVQADRQLAGPGHRGVHVERVVRGVRKERAELVGAHDAAARGTRGPIERDRPAKHLGRGRRHAGEHHLRRLLEEDPVGPAVVAAPDDPARGIGRVRGDARRDERGGARPQRVQVERPKRDVPAGHRALEVVGVRPAPPPALVPARAQDPAGRRDARRGVDDHLQRGVDRRCGEEVQRLGGDRRIDEVDVGVDEPGQGDLARRELDPPRSGVGRRLDVCARRRPPGPSPSAIPIASTQP